MSKKSAFTMVELIFVIVILGILAAVAVPKMNASRDDAKTAASIANLKVLMTDLQTFHLAKGKFPIYAKSATTEKDCTDFGGKWAAGTPNGTCTGASVKDLTKISNVTLRQDTTNKNIYIMDIGKSDTCLKFELESASALKVTTSTAASATGSQCAKFLNIGSVKAILKGKVSTTKGAADQVVGSGTQGTAQSTYFDFSTGSIS